MWNTFFNHVDIRPANVNILDGNADDLCRRNATNTRRIVEAGGIDLFLGGVGEDGHMAFNEPFSSLNSRTRLKTLTQDTIQVNARFFGGDISLVPKTALTVGVGTVLSAKKVLILAHGPQESPRGAPRRRRPLLTRLHDLGHPGAPPTGFSSATTRDRGTEGRPPTAISRTSSAKT